MYYRSKEATRRELIIMGVQEDLRTLQNMARDNNIQNWETLPPQLLAMLWLFPDLISPFKVIQSGKVPCSFAENHQMGEGISFEDIKSVLGASKNTVLRDFVNGKDAALDAIVGQLRKITKGG